MLGLNKLAQFHEVLVQTHHIRSQLREGRLSHQRVRATRWLLLVIWVDVAVSFVYCGELGARWRMQECFRPAPDPAHSPLA